MLYLDDGKAWLDSRPSDSVYAIVTDPPFGVKEYDPAQIERRSAGGGVWRQPPALGGKPRSPLPRFTALSPRELGELSGFFRAWGASAFRAMRPGAHAIVASNAYLSLRVFAAIAESGLEFRGEIIRLVRTLRGGDRPKGAEGAFPDVCTFPRGCYEPWGVFRKPLPKRMTVAQCLERWGTGGLRRLGGAELRDVIVCGPAGDEERACSNHPSLKPQALMRRLVWAALPTGEGEVVDTFAGSGSTLAAARALGLAAVGTERNKVYYREALESIPRLAALKVEAVAPKGKTPAELWGGA